MELGLEVGISNPPPGRMQKGGGIAFWPPLSPFLSCYISRLQVFSLWVVTPIEGGGGGGGVAATFQSKQGLDPVQVSIFGAPEFG